MSSKVIYVNIIIQPPRRLKYSYVIVRPLSTVGYTSVVASVIRSRQWSN